MEALLNSEISNQVKEAFNQLDQEVEVLFFGRQENCEFCDQTQQLVFEVTELSDKLSLTIYDVEIHTVAETREHYCRQRISSGTRIIDST